MALDGAQASTLRVSAGAVTRVVNLAPIRGFHVGARTLLLKDSSERSRGFFPRSSEMETNCYFQLPMLVLWIPRAGISQ